MSHVFLPQTLERLWSFLKFQNDLLEFSLRAHDVKTSNFSAGNGKKNVFCKLQNTKNWLHKFIFLWYFKDKGKGANDQDGLFLQVLPVFVTRAERPATIVLPDWQIQTNSIEVKISITAENHIIHYFFSIFINASHGMYIKKQISHYIFHHRFVII